MANKEFKINEYISVRLEYGKTVIFINEKEFIHCKFLLIFNPQENELQNEINSIDEADEFLSRKLESEVSPIELGISSEQEFWGHCSNLQAWSEHGYDTRLLHSNISFPLLRKLTEVGDPQAKKVFKNEVAIRFLSGYLPVSIFLLKERYLDILDKEEFDTLISELESSMDDLNSDLIRFNKAKDWNLLGIAFRKKSMDDIAMKAFKIALTIDDRDVYTWNNIGLVLDEKKDYDGAIKAYKKAIEIDNDFKFGWHNTGVALEGKKQFKKAIEAYKKALEIDDKYFDSYHGLGFSHESLEEYDKAIEMYKRGLEIKPHDKIVLNNLGNVYDVVGEHDKAMDMLNKAIAVDPDYVDAINNLGMSYYYKKEYERAKHYFLMARDKDETYDLAWSNLSEIFDIQDDFEKSLKMAKQAIKLNPKNYEAWFFHGHGKYKKGAFNDAISSYKNALKLDLNDKRRCTLKDDKVWLYLSKAYYKKADIRKALHACEVSLKITPNNDDSLKFREKLL